MSTRTLLTVMALATLSLPAPPASAHSGVGYFAGTSSVSPGIPTTGCVAGPTWQASGTMAGPGARTYAVTFNGNSSVCASLLSDAGTATASGGVAGSLRYVRQSNVMTLTGAVAVDGHVHSTTCELHWGATSFNPVSSATVTGPCYFA